jgi:hypothetical protein
VNLLLISTDVRRATSREARDINAGQDVAGLVVLTCQKANATLPAGGSRKGSKGNAVRVLAYAMPRLPPQL